MGSSSEFQSWLRWQGEDTQLFLVGMFGADCRNGGLKNRGFLRSKVQGTEVF